MTRTAAREIAVHLVFELGFSRESVEVLLASALNTETFALIGQELALYEAFPDDEQLGYITALVRGVAEHGVELDGYIEQYLRGWSFQRINRVAIAIMRVAMYEILYMPNIPNRAAINEAVEIAKGYETAEVVSFLNGVLGSFVREQLPREAE